jgi:hypothetical protein
MTSQSLLIADSTLKRATKLIANNSHIHGFFFLFWQKSPMTKMQGAVKSEEGFFSGKNVTKSPYFEGKKW